MEEFRPNLNDPHTERAWVALGDKIEVNPDRQAAAETEFERRELYARKSQTHLWTVIIVHFANDTMLNAFTSGDPADMPMLDAESIAMRPALVCYICSEPYNPRLRMRKCKGEPRG